MKKALLMLPLVLCMYACGGGGKQETKEEKQETSKKEEPAKTEEANPDAAIVGKWRIDDISSDETNLKSLPEADREKGVKHIESIKKNVMSNSFEFTKDGHFIVYIGEKEDSKGMYEIRSSGKELVFKDDSGGEFSTQLVKITESKMEYNSFIPFGENESGPKLMVNYKLKK